MPVIQFRHTVKEFQVELLNTYSSVEHYLFVCIQLDGQTVLFLTIQFDISHSFASSFLFDPWKGSYQVLLLRVRVDLGAMI